ncbi:HDOD domain-containing protein [Massilia sp. GCM10020059]|uniref:HDOD domain-containing protein n=1 Tax=Massilia agrisoli TaxID=2892444 RepID=A0ABS8ING5_9BURK|nr:HDOD domain-containing protein [Massilia agrisoli]MCC6070109.1 HDOD domain-containing protein [Massilia agrisoli]
MTLDELLHNPKALPTAPKVLADLIHSFEDPDVPVAHITRTLSADPVLSAKLLRLANSAYYKMSRSVATVDDAVRMLGFVTVRTLVISSGLVNGFKDVPPGLDLQRFWRYSLNTAVAARWIASRTGEDADLAFTIGLMHAIGLVIIHAGMPAQAQELDDDVGPYDPGRMQHEMRAFGFSFYDVGAGLAQRWKFPAVFTRTIREVPAPLQATPPDRLAAVIHLAAWRAQLNEAREAPDDIAGETPTGVAALFALEPGRLLEDMPPLAELSAGLEELIK